MINIWNVMADLKDSDVDWTFYCYNNPNLMWMLFAHIHSFKAFFRTHCLHDTEENMMNYNSIAKARWSKAPDWELTFKVVSSMPSHASIFHPRLIKISLSVRVIEICRIFKKIGGLKNCWHGWGLNPKPHLLLLSLWPLTTRPRRSWWSQWQL